MGNKQTTSSSPVIGAPGRTPSAGRPAPGQPAQLRVMCPSCHTLLVPPASLFRCPCGQIMTYQLPASSAAGAVAAALGGASAARSVPEGGPVVPPRGGSTILFSGTGRAGSLAAAPPDVQMQLMSASVEERIRFLLAHLPPDSPHAAIFRTLLERMPRRADGVTIDFAALEVLSHTLVANSGLAGPGGGSVSGAGAGASPEMLELLPTRTFKAKLPTAAPAAAGSAAAPSASGSEATAGGAGAANPNPAVSGSGGGSARADDEGEDRSCKICQCDYEDGEELVTLPCLHFFHASCAKEWLKRKRICALCRMPIDIDMDAALAEALAKEEEAAAAKPEKKEAATPAGAAGGGAAGAPGFAAAASRQPSGRAGAGSGQSESSSSSGGLFARWRRGSR